MKISDFVKEVNKVSNDSMKEKRIKTMLNVKPYVSIADKINLAENVTRAATNEVDKNGNIIGFKINSLTKYLLHVLGLVGLYTDLEIDYKNAVGEYDLLNSNGLIATIIKQIGENEIAECQLCLDMMWNDMIQNTLSTHAFIKDQVTRFGTLAGATLSPMIESLAKAVDGLDDEKVKAIVDAIGTKH